jgi:peptidyl-prolyl cis-trans isomerase A (cyclophilin A)
MTMKPAKLIFVFFLVATAALGAGLANGADARTTVALETELGTIEIEVFATAAPLSAGSFLAFVEAGLLDGGSFYRTVSPANDHGEPAISVIQGGVTEERDHPAPVAHETTEMTGIRHEDGIVSLARAEVGTASGAAFFICIGDQPGLDYGGMRNTDGQGFAAFGKVVAGMDVVHAIHRREAKGPSESPYTEGQMLTDPVKILAARKTP